MKNTNRKRKILWICNVPLPEAERLAGHRTTITVSWLINTSELLSSKVDLTIAYPQKTDRAVQTLGKTIAFYAIPCRTKNRYDTNLQRELEKLYIETKPDVIHIWGTEFPHTYSAISASEKMGLLDHTVVSIQGLVSICAIHLKEAMPAKIQKKHTVRTFLFHSRIWDEKKLYDYKGKYEIQAIKTARHVIGRTEWDRACTTLINPSISYHHNDEILRDIFYQHVWSYRECRKHTIFLSQGTGSVKGLWYALDALEIIKKHHPDVKMVTTARSIYQAKEENKWWLLTAYDKAILEKARRLNLTECIEYQDLLDEEKMCKEYLRANVAITPSVIENSPNSMGEAMLLGVPVVAADVGGISSLLNHGKEGYLYPYNEPYMLAYYIMKVFDLGQGAERISMTGRNRAISTHDPSRNIDDLLHIYDELSKSD